MLVRDEERRVQSRNEGITAVSVVFEMKGR